MARPGWISVLLLQVLLLCIPALAKGVEEEEEEILATFDGGTIILLDIDASAAKNYEAMIQGTLEEDRALVERQAGGREKLVRKLALDRILTQVAEAHGIPLGVTAESRLKVDLEKILGAIYFSRLAEREIEKARRTFLARCLQYYREHPDEFMEPALWTFRYILVGIPVGSERAKTLYERPKEDWDKTLLTPEERETYLEKAQKVYKLCRSGEDFVSLAGKHSVSEAEGRGRLIGPTSGEDYSPLIASALRELATGEISPPVETPFGFFILRCEGFAPAQPRPYQDALPEIREELGGFQEGRIISQIQHRLWSRHPYVSHEEALSEDPRVADALVLEGTLATIANRDVFRPDIKSYLAEIDGDTGEIMHLARLMYRRRLHYLLAVQGGIQELPVAKRACLLRRERAFRQVVMDYLKAGNSLESLPLYKRSDKTYGEKVFERFNYRFVDD